MSVFLMYLKWCLLLVVAIGCRIFVVSFSILFTFYINVINMSGSECFLNCDVTILFVVKEEIAYLPFWLSFSCYHGSFLQSISRN